MFPEWIKKKACYDDKFLAATGMLKELNLNTVCEEANCPNICECFRCNSLTFMILGKTCTRNCGFCSVRKDKPLPVDTGEPGRIVLAIKKLKLKYVVITSPTRDDLPDGGARQFAAVTEKIREYDGKIGIELLIPDFGGVLSSIELVADSKPDVIAHNLETVPRLYQEVRQMASYSRSLEVLSKITGTKKKSGLMLGLGETKKEVSDVMEDMRKAGCGMLTLGQYLKPSKESLEVKRFVTPDEFKEYENLAVKMGFSYVVSSPFARSSYKAHLWF